MDREAEKAVKQASDEALARGAKFYAIIVDTKRIGDEVFALCTARFTNGVALQPDDRLRAKLAADEADTKRMNANIERWKAAQRAEAARNAPLLEAEDRAATRSYGDCLFSHAKLLALASTESAEVIREATFAACRKQRDAILEVHRRFKDDLFSAGALDVADKQLAGAVLLEIIKSRVASPPQPAPQPPADKGI